MGKNGLQAKGIAFAKWSAWVKKNAKNMRKTTLESHTI